MFERFKGSRFYNNFIWFHHHAPWYFKAIVMVLTGLSFLLFYYCTVFIHPNDPLYILFPLLFIWSVFCLFCLIMMFVVSYKISLILIGISLLSNINHDYFILFSFPLAVWLGYCGIFPLLWFLLTPVFALTAGERAINKIEISYNDSLIKRKMAELAKINNKLAALEKNDE